MEYGLDLLKRCLCFARRNPENLFFSEDDCHPTLYSFTNNGWSLRLLEKTWQQLFLIFVSNKFVFLCNLSCYCKRNCLASVGLFGDNKSASFFAIELTLWLTCFLKDKQRLKTEDTLYKLDISRHRPICGFLPAECQSLRQTFQRIIQALLFAKHLHRLCCWFEWLEA